jgi:hypothetical protein
MSNKTQMQAMSILEEIMQHKLHEQYNACTGNAETCPIEECMLCGVRDCQGNEPLHYHHDGCPYCHTHNVEFGK